MSTVLGISCFESDAAACLVRDGLIVAAAQEERFSRIEHDPSFPTNAVRYCLAEAGVPAGTIDAVAFHDKPILRFGRILETYLSVVPSGLRSFMREIPTWLRDRLWTGLRIRNSLEQAGVTPPERIYYPAQPESHAASAFFPSPFPEAAILTLDAAGEWATAALGVGEGSRLRLLKQLSFPHSLGLLHSAFADFVGLGAGAQAQIIDLTAYGRGGHADLIRQHLLDLRDDGSFRLDLDYLGFLDPAAPTHRRFAELLGREPRKRGAPLSADDADLARSVQDVIEEIVLKMAGHARRETGKEFLCLAGGVALNPLTNARLRREGIFKDVWVQPAAGAAGGAVGAALAVWHGELDHPREVDGSSDGMQGACLGPEFSREQVRDYLVANGFPHRELRDAEWAPALAKLVASGKLVGLVQGRMEFGPRALGNRVILADPRSAAMHSRLNRRLRFQEDYRPLSSACLAERIGDYFELDGTSPYGLFAARLRGERCRRPVGDEDGLDLYARVGRERSDLPAITHVDYSARVQSVAREAHPRLRALLEAFEALTGCGALITEAFRAPGEPIVCTPEDAYRCFMRTKLDHLVLGSFLLDKAEQHPWGGDPRWQAAFEAPEPAGSLYAGARS